MVAAMRGTRKQTHEKALAISLTNCRMEGKNTGMAGRAGLWQAGQVGQGQSQRTGNTGNGNVKHQGRAAQSHHSCTLLSNKKRCRDRLAC